MALDQERERAMAGFRQYLELLDAEGLVRHVDEPVAAADVPRWTWQEEQRKNRVLLFSRVPGFGGRIAANVFADHRRICRALGARTMTEMFDRVDAARAALPGKPPAPLPPEEGLRLEAPRISAVVPLIRYCRDDATPYITSAVVLAADPDSGQRHLCYVRLACIGGNRLLFNPATPRIKAIAEKTVLQGKELPVTLLIAPPVEFAVTAGLSFAGEVDKLDIAAALGRMTPVAEETGGAPAAAEITLKGRVIPQFEAEGPFGDLKGTYSPKPKSPVCVIDAAFCREAGVFHALSAGRAREHIAILSLAPRYYLEGLRKRLPGILRYEIPRFAGGRLAVVAVREDCDRGRLAELLWKTPIVRFAVLVNADVDLRSSSDVLWALVQRVRNAEHFAFSREHHPVSGEQRIVVDAAVGDLSAWENRRVKVYGARSG
jgi:UbiD family decarboxylase